MMADTCANDTSPHALLLLVAPGAADEAPVAAAGSAGLAVAPMVAAAIEGVATDEVADDFAPLWQPAAVTPMTTTPIVAPAIEIRITDSVRRASAYCRDPRRELNQPRVTSR